MSTHVHVNINAQLNSLNLYFSVKPTIAKVSRNIGKVTMRVNDPETKITCAVKEAYPRNITFIWEIQTYTTCSQESGDCKPIEKNWNQVLSSKEYSIASGNLKSVLTLRKNIKSLYIRCKASNSAGSDSHVWKLIILAGRCSRSSDEQMCCFWHHTAWLVSRKVQFCLRVIIKISKTFH